MNWAALGRKLIGLGAPILGGALGGPAGAAAGRILADQLGIEATPEAVARQIEENPDTVIGAARSLETGDEIAGYYRLAVQTADTGGAVARLDAASGDRFQRWARPAWLWGSLLVWLPIGLAIAWQIWSGGIDKLTAIASAMASLGWFFSLPLVVNGLFAWGRNTLKEAAMTGQPASLTSAIARRIAGK